MPLELPPSPPPASSVAIAPEDTQSNLRIKSLITEEAREHANKVLKYLFFVVIGAIAAALWNLNGEIYKAVGETGGGTTKAQEIEINRLRSEVRDLHQQIITHDCLDNKKVIDKAGCYHGH